MSESYAPDSGVAPESPFDTVLLSQRDVALTIPINYVTNPGVSLTAACFSQNKYEDDSTAACLSNLLAVGFRRFEIDIFWDEVRALWSFCPISIPTAVPGALSASTSASSIRSSSASLTSTTTDSTRPRTTSGSSLAITARELSSSAIPDSDASPTTSATSGVNKSLGSILPSISVVPDSPDQPLVEIGSYSCTTTINLSTFVSLLLNYIQKTQNTLDAHILYVAINVHAAANNTSPSAPASEPTTLPQGANLLGGMFTSNLSSYIYSPSNLMSERVDINNSWYRVDEQYRPVEEYYVTLPTEYGARYTEDGWPSESYIEFSESKRLLLEFGTIDPQMAKYNVTADQATIFPANYIQANQSNVSADESGKLISGCFLRANTDVLAQVNSSWATVAQLSDFTYPTISNADIDPLLDLTANITSCGISPTLNTTLLGSTAQKNFTPYQNYSYATIWSWAPGEPAAYTSSSGTTDSLFRCATSDLNHGGRWVVVDCSSKYYAACRAQGQPYNWTVTSYAITYSYADQACPDSYEFGVPRTALENSYLTQAIQRSSRDYDGHGVLIDFNSLDYPHCWTSGGPNATCPYADTVKEDDSIERRQILVPTVAAIIVLVITALTLFGKMAGNRTIRKRVKKRVENGMVYEGVPS